MFQGALIEAAIDLFAHLPDDVQAAACRDYTEALDMLGIQRGGSAGAAPASFDVKAAAREIRQLADRILSNSEKGK